jgi:hypothetical protein
MSMPMNASASVPTGLYQAQINFISRTNQKGCVKITEIEIKKK